jgi:hypothetical protein
VRGGVDIPRDFKGFIGAIEVREVDPVVVATHDDARVEIFVSKLPESPTLETPCARIVAGTLTVGQSITLDVTTCIGASGLSELRVKISDLDIVIRDQDATELMHIGTALMGGRQYKAAEALFHEGEQRSRDARFIYLRAFTAFLKAMDCVRAGRSIQCDPLLFAHDARSIAEGELAVRLKQVNDSRTRTDADRLLGEIEFRFYSTAIAKQRFQSFIDEHRCSDSTQQARLFLALLLLHEKERGERRRAIEHLHDVRKMTIPSDCPKWLTLVGFKNILVAEAQDCGSPSPLVDSHALACAALHAARAPVKSECGAVPDALASRIINMLRVNIQRRANGESWIGSCGKP